MNNIPHIVNTGASVMNKPVAIPFAWYCAWLGKDDEPVWEQYEECHPTSKEWDNFPDKIIPLYTHPVNELTKNITGVWRMSDQSIQIVFTSCRSASEFEAILRKASEK